MADGSFLITGGGDPNICCYHSVNNATKFSLGTGSTPGGWVPIAPMQVDRWYPSATTLGDGRILVTAGHRDVECVSTPPPGEPCDDCLRYFVDTPEVYDPNATTNPWTLLAPLPMSYYPFMFVNTDGRVFNAGPGVPGYTYFLNMQMQPPQWTGGPQSVTFVPVIGLVGLSSNAGCAVMYEPGKVLKCGGQTSPHEAELVGLAAVVDLESPSPAWNFDNPGNMKEPRLNHNAVILADGSVLLVGGNEVEFVPGDPPVWNPHTGPPILAAELWRPWLPEGWQLMASMVKDRTHHSIACLLADGTVLSTSGDDEPLPGLDITTAEIYSPPYLFNASGPAARPLIGFAPARVSYGQPFRITVPTNSPVPAGQIAKVTLLRLASVTHGVDMDQRFVLLAPPVVSGNNLNVVAPANGNLAPPGNYMLFIISNTGVPSVAWDILVAP